ncbi:homoserine dehydrogenase [Brevibacillus sp. NRS-1366]|uniref:homoserine dehydrogenase n=1 Tax=Brevibacillus sp. NRS-1366 TaxID=3233899 RepID=UPI003D233456
MKRWNIVITGFGTVGRQVARLIEQRQNDYREKYQADVRLVGFTRSTSGCYHPEGLVEDQWQAFCQKKQEKDIWFDGPAFLASCEADVLIEAGPTDIQTGGPGLLYIQQALEKRMHAITISKGALVVDYAGLSALAKKQGVSLKISGATAAALPTIDLINYNLAGCEIKAVEGIFTGTTNFVLTSMIEQGISQEEAIKMAQQMGIAEPDPSYDIDGWDTACKVTILANAAFGAQLQLTDIPRMSVKDVTLEQISTWKKEGKIPKLIGSIRKIGDEIVASVILQAVGSSHPFANVKGSTKAIRVETDVMGDLLVIGGKSDPVAAAAAALKDFEHIICK